MKTITAIIVCFVCTLFIGNMLLAEEESDIVKRHRDWMERVNLGVQSQNASAVSKQADATVAPKDIPGDGTISNPENDAINAAKKD